MGAGRKTGGGGRRAGKRTQTSRGDAAKVREWAQSQGIEVSSRGRIPADLMERYEAAH
ncbi:Lsr2 family DNA-binding protein [Streptomyces agglomeratus]|nr:histone-like nucleoid-structuring protein Lsr2 [Streptomyces agglomeratus]